MSNTSKARSYRVEGMTCGHCRLSVIEEISEIEGVESVEVDLEAGRAEVEGRFTDDQVRDAVAAAGYRLAEAR